MASKTKNRAARAAGNGSEIEREFYRGLDLLRLEVDSLLQLFEDVASDLEKRLSRDPTFDEVMSELGKEFGVSRYHRHPLVKRKVDRLRIAALSYAKEQPEILANQLARVAWLVALGEMTPNAAVAEAQRLRRDGEALEVGAVKASLNGRSDRRPASTAHAVYNVLAEDADVSVPRDTYGGLRGPMKALIQRTKPRRPQRAGDDFKLNLDRNPPLFHRILRGK